MSEIKRQIWFASVTGILCSVALLGFGATCTAQPGEGLKVPAGTVLNASLQHGVASNVSMKGDRIEALLLDPIYVGGKLAMPANTRLNGYVKEVVPAGRVKGNGSIELLFHEAMLPNGARTAINANWEATAPGKRKRDAWVVGGSALGGALLGQILGGNTEDTIKGGVAGGAVGTGVVLLNKGRDLMLRPRTILIMELKVETTVPAPE